jgi:tubulin--tyrosine ligase
VNSASKQKFLQRGKKGEKDEDEKEENPTSHGCIMYAKMENNYHLSNKKAIYYNMKVYYEAIGRDYFKSLPLTFHIKEGLNDPQFLKFEQLYKDATDPSITTVLDQLPKFGKQLWIIKPGENTNRGCGIQVSKDLDHIKGLIQNTTVNGVKRSYIIQKYIEKPLLYKQRKFDIRCFTLMCTINGNL